MFISVLPVELGSTANQPCGHGMQSRCPIAQQVSVFELQITQRQTFGVVALDGHEHKANRFRVVRAAGLCKGVVRVFVNLDVCQNLVHINLGQPLVYLGFDLVGVDVLGLLTSCCLLYTSDAADD